ncbi:hypothetical protein NHX12_012785 [Muraenolepis orangiensis]|uniref:Uncharacterized protein n=1 Tax=Muraenolepis orangiensis TaxID=630683 RepID=A0A9Q0DDP3_9TELE|nr:hypothetical protein NHX12_012785 [Muraenolepis orangiensis]
MPSPSSPVVPRHIVEELGPAGRFHVVRRCEQRLQAGGRQSLGPQPQHLVRLLPGARATASSSTCSITFSTRTP